MATYKFVNADQLDADLLTVADKIREKAELSDPLAFPSGFVDGIDQCSSLNFSVVGGTTQPSDPKENTIWVNTDTEIPSWSMGDYPNPTWEMSEGHVYINIKASSYGSNDFDFGILKKGNEICIAPLSAKQYVDGVYVDVPAMIYQDGKWAEWFITLLNGSDLCDDITGGWIQTSDVNIAGETNSGTVSVSDDGITLTNPGNGTSTVCRSVKKIDFAGKTTLTATMKAIKVENNISIRLYIFNSLGDIDNSMVARIQNVAYTDFDEYSIDVSALDGEYYIALAANMSRAGTCKKINLK